MRVLLLHAYSRRNKGDGLLVDETNGLLQRAFGPGQAARDPVPSGIIDPLTSRELEVLEMLAAGRSNQAIAGELVVTLDTVKKHVGHVLGKLGAANRTEAVARARELNLL